MKKSKRRYTPKQLQKAVDAYFDALTYEVPAMREEILLDDRGRPMLDAYGHVQKVWLPIVTASGEKATVTKWVQQPSEAALCLQLGMNRATFWRYGQDPAYAGIVQEAKGRIEAYLSQKLEDKGASQGAKFSLQHNYGWGQVKQEENGMEIKVSFGGTGEDPFG